MSGPNLATVFTCTISDFELGEKLQKNSTNFLYIWNKPHCNKSKIFRLKLNMKKKLFWIFLLQKNITNFEQFIWRFSWNASSEIMSCMLSLNRLPVYECIILHSKMINRSIRNSYEYTNFARWQYDKSILPLDPIVIWQVCR